MIFRMTTEKPLNSFHRMCSALDCGQDKDIPLRGAQGLLTVLSFGISDSFVWIIHSSDPSEGTSMTVHRHKFLLNSTNMQS